MSCPRDDKDSGPGPKEPSRADTDQVAEADVSARDFPEININATSPGKLALELFKQQNINFAMGRGPQPREEPLVDVENVKHIDTDRLTDLKHRRQGHRTKD